MTIVLLAVGLLATAAGLVTIGFGIPINAFSLGNTLIISGTIAVASGLILIGLALVLGQLRRIAEALKGKTLARAPNGRIGAERRRRNWRRPSRRCPMPSPRNAAASEPPRAPDLTRAEPPLAPRRRSRASRRPQASRRPVRSIGCVPNPSR